MRTALVARSVEVVIQDWRDSMTPTHSSPIGYANDAECAGTPPFQVFPRELWMIWKHLPSTFPTKNSGCFTHYPAKQTSGFFHAQTAVSFEFCPSNGSPFCKGMENLFFSSCSSYVQLPAASNTPCSYRILSPIPSKATPPATPAQHRTQPIRPRRAPAAMPPALISVHTIPIIIAGNIIGR